MILPLNEPLNIEGAEPVKDVLPDTFKLPSTNAFEPESIKKPVFLVPNPVPVPTANTVSADLALLPSCALNLPTINVPCVLSQFVIGIAVGEVDEPDITKQLPNNPTATNEPESDEDSIDADIFAPAKNPAYILLIGVALAFVPAVLT
jgi:hypothetical protein